MTKLVGVPVKINKNTEIIYRGFMSNCIMQLFYFLI